MLNLDFYKGKDIYSDGDIEEEILSIVKGTDDFTNILANDNRWPILYHLSPERRNLLEWYPYNKEANLLEIGAGCGALTGLFCEKLNKVIAVELSKRRAEIIRQRHKDANNLEIIVGNIIDIEFNLKFDYVTLIGVLEYTKSFIKTQEPYKNLFNIISNLMKQEGKLIIAIENKFGLKYFAGAKEDHTGKMFDSIEGYGNIENIEIFGRQEIKGLLRDNGFTEIKFYYPHPDYKFCNEIFSEIYQPDINHILAECPNYDYERFKLFNESSCFLNITKNKTFEFFANSFLIIASKAT
ncbi:MAG: methyltransferase [Candidatus Eremiobacterota bacterium]